MNEFSLGERIWQHRLTRRDFLWLMGATTGSAMIAGCAPNPVTGQSQLMLMSESQEIQTDKEQSPHQFSEDFGVVQLPAINQYVRQVGQGLSGQSHRPQMPYSFQAVGANHVNAYAFPGGSVAVTRGILTELNNEAELAALLGHEVGHVNARHAAARMSTGLLTEAIMAGAVLAVSVSKYKDYAPAVQTLGVVGTGALLAHYSREDERQADALGMEYMTRANYAPQGMVGLMQTLQEKSQGDPSIVELMFATHPMSSERLQTAQQLAATQYGRFQAASMQRERYMDITAPLRQLKPAIELQRKGEELVGDQRYTEAEQMFAQSLRKAPNDYTGLVLMSKLQVEMDNPQKAQQYAEKAKQIYPTEAQAQHVSGVARIMLKQFDRAYADFNTYERVLPGNPQTVFLKATCLEGMHNQQAAAQEYQRYVTLAPRGAQASHALQRLQAWGYR